MRPGGATDYADAMEAGYNELQPHGRAGVQKIIVLLSDGAANQGQNCVTTTNRRGQQIKDHRPHCMQPCQSAVNDAATYKQQGILIYTILYGDQSGGINCQDYTGDDEVPVQQPWTAMQAIASPEQLLPRSQPRQPDRDLPADRIGHGRRHQPHRQLAPASPRSTPRPSPTGHSPRTCPGRRRKLAPRLGKGAVEVGRVGHMPSRAVTG